MQIGLDAWRGRVSRLPFSRHHLSSIIISDTNDKHLYFTFKNCVHPIFLQASVSVYSGSARVWNVICATVGKQVGCGDLCRTLRDHFNPLANYQAKYPTCYLTSKTAVEDDGKIFPFSNTGFIYAWIFKVWRLLFCRGGAPQSITRRGNPAYRTSLQKQTVTMFRDAAIQDKSLEEYTSLVTPYINKCDGDVVIIKTATKQLQSIEMWGLFSEPKNCLSVRWLMHTTLPEQEWKLESRRERGDINRDLNKNSNILKMSQECHCHALGHVAGYAEHILCFDLKKKESAGKSTLLPEDWPLLLTTAGVRKILLRLNVNDIL